MYKLTAEERERALSLLMKVMAIPSVNGVSREADVADYLKSYFSDTGYTARVQQIDEKRGNFILEVPGEETDHYMVWNGHMDTVPYGDVSAWATDPAVPVIKEDGRLYGRGASDMKSGLCAMAFALHLLAERGVKPRETVRFLGTCDEEKGGAGAAAILEGNLFGDPDFLLIGEPTDCQLGIAQKGCIWLELTVKGKTCHGAYPWMGINAAEIGFELCQQIKTYVSWMEHPVLSQATASITQVHGGVANNMIPDEVRFIMDVRTVPGVSHEKLLQEIDSLKQVMEISYPGLEVKVQILNERIPVEISRGHHRAKQLRKAAERATGKVPEDMGINFFTDASVFLRKKQVPTLLFGPGSPALCHKTDESMELARYYEAIETYMEFLAMGDEAEG